MNSMNNHNNKKNTKTFYTNSPKKESNGKRNRDRKNNNFFKKRSLRDSRRILQEKSWIATFKSGGGSYKEIERGKSMKEKDSEKRARMYVTHTLKELGWNIKKPQKGGNLLQEGEAQKYDSRIKEALQNASKSGKCSGFLDFLLVNNDKVVSAIIETKPDKTDIKEAIKDAKHYVSFLNKIDGFDIKILIGVAGNEEEGVTVENYYLDNNVWKIIESHEQKLTQIITYEELEQCLKNEKPSLDVAIPSLDYLYLRSDKINKILHKHKVEEASRAKVIASIILAMYQGNFSLDINLVIQDINTRVKEALNECKKTDQIYSMLSLNKHDKLLAKAIPLVIHELKKVNINALMKSGYDVLGTFYEVFLKYGGDNKQLGIVFTPRHITDFCTDIIGITSKDKIYDPTCGTGGFLVSAFNRFRELVNYNKHLIKKIGDSQIFGNDTSTSAYPLGVVNMIFRGDGKNNIIFKNCFEYPEEKQFTKVLMNPPFQTDGDDPIETEFIDHALNCLEVGGKLISVIPFSILVQSGECKKWRENIIGKHTLEAVFSLPHKTFYPVSITTALVFIKAHIPQKEEKTFFCKITEDGFIEKKGKRIKVKDGQIEEAGNNFISKITKPAFSCYKKINYKDQDFDLSPESYLDGEKWGDIELEVKQLIRYYYAFKIIHEDKLSKVKDSVTNINLPKHKDTEYLSDLFEIDYGQREYHNKEDLKKGNTLLISSQSKQNGCYGYFNINPIYKEKIITVPSTGSVGYAFVQLKECCVDDNCLTLIPKKQLSIEELFYIACVVRRERWRFKYGRQITPFKLGNFKVNFKLFDKKSIEEFREKFKDI